MEHPTTRKSPYKGVDNATLPAAGLSPKVGSRAEFARQPLLLRRLCAVAALGSHQATVTCTYGCNGVQRPPPGSGVASPVSKAQDAAAVCFRGLKHAS